MEGRLSRIARGRGPVAAARCRSPRGPLALLTPFIAGATLACSEPPRPPDIILLSLDSVRADELTFRDAGVSPHLAELANRGTVFNRAVSGSSWTLPSHAQMFTGQPPQLHGVQDDERNIDPVTRTLPECLSDAGYATAGFWSGWFLAGEYGFARGFDRYEGVLEVDDAADQHDPGTRQGFIQREHSSHRQITSRKILAAAREAIDEAPDSAPLFLFGHFFDPHYDYIPPPPFDTRFDPDYEGDIDGRDFWANKRIFDAEKRPMRQISDRDLDHVRALYRGEIAWTDGVIGELLALLEERGRLDNALVIVTSDHGEEFFEHGNRGHRQGLYDEVLRVPLLVVPPRSGAATPAGESVRDSVDTLVSLSDLMPTVLEAARLDVPRSVWGRSLLPLVEGRDTEADRERYVVSTLTTRVDVGDSSATLVMDSLHTGSTKLIRQVRIPAGGRPAFESLLWFDLGADRGELRPRIDPKRPQVAGAWQRLEQEMARMRAFHAELPHSSPDERHTDVRQIFEADLGALGYAEGSNEPLPSADEKWTLEPLPALQPE